MNLARVDQRDRPVRLSTGGSTVRADTRVTVTTDAGCKLQRRRLEINRDDLDRDLSISFSQSPGYLISSRLREHSAPKNEMVIIHI